MCSSPGLLQREGVVELAVKYTKHPPAHWVHTVVSAAAAADTHSLHHTVYSSYPFKVVLLILKGSGVRVRGHFPGKLFRVPCKDRAEEWEQSLKADLIVRKAV